MIFGHVYEGHVASSSYPPYNRPIFVSGEDAKIVGARIDPKLTIQARVEKDPEEGGIWASV